MDELKNQRIPTVCCFCSGISYACVALPDDASDVTTTLSCLMKFLVKDCDPNTGEADDDGYDDEYMVSSSTTPESSLYLFAYLSSFLEKAIKAL